MHFFVCLCPLLTVCSAIFHALSLASISATLHIPDVISCRFLEKKGFVGKGSEILIYRRKMVKSANFRI